MRAIWVLIVESRNSRQGLLQCGRRNDASDYRADCAAVSDEREDAFEPRNADSAIRPAAMSADAIPGKSKD